MFPWKHIALILLTGIIFSLDSFIACQQCKHRDYLFPDWVWLRITWERYADIFLRTAKGRAAGGPWLVAATAMHSIAAWRTANVPAPLSGCRRLQRRQARRAMQLSRSFRSSTSTSGTDRAAVGGGAAWPAGRPPATSTR